MGGLLSIFNAEGVTNTVPDGIVGDQPASWIIGRGIPIPRDLDNGARQEVAVRFAERCGHPAARSTGRTG